MIVAHRHIARAFRDGEREGLGARRRQPQRLAMRPAGRGNCPEVGGIAVAELEGAAAAGHRQIGRPDEQAVDRVEGGDRLDVGERPRRLDHRMADRAPVLGREEPVIDIVVGAIAHGAAVADAAAAERRIFGVAAGLAGMRQVGDLRQHDAVRPEVERLLDAQPLRRRDPHI